MKFWCSTSAKLIKYFFQIKALAWKWYEINISSPKIAAYYVVDDQKPKEAI